MGVIGLHKVVQRARMHVSSHMCPLVLEQRSLCRCGCACAAVCVCVHRWSRQPTSPKLDDGYKLIVLLLLFWQQPDMSSFVLYPEIIIKQTKTTRLHCWMDALNKTENNSNAWRRLRWLLCLRKKRAMVRANLVLKGKKEFKDKNTFSLLQNVRKSSHPSSGEGDFMHS